MCFAPLLFVGAVILIADMCHSLRVRDQSTTANRPVVVFEAPEPGGLIAAPAVGDDGTFYLAAYHARGFRLAGAVYAIDPVSKKTKWTFTANGTMLPTASQPVLHAGKLFVGEGMHANFQCRMFCLDPATGEQVWAKEVSDHVEGGVCPHGNAVIFAAGNDGVWCVDAATGKDRWHFAADVHVDSTPCVVNGVVIVGSGPSRRFKNQQVLGLDAKSGAVKWRVPAKFPAWGSPAVADDLALVGLGTGRLTEAGKEPGGALFAVGAAGNERWTAPAADAVFQKPLVHGNRVTFGSRDGKVRSLSCETGRVIFTADVGGPVLSTPAASGTNTFACTLAGRLVKLDAAGTITDEWDLAAASGTAPRIFAPLLIHRGTLYVAGEFVAGDRGSACLYALPAAAE